MEFDVPASQYATPDLARLTPRRRRRFEAHQQRIQQEVDDYFHPSNLIVPSPWTNQKPELPVPSMAWRSSSPVHPSGLADTETLLSSARISGIASPVVSPLQASSMQGKKRTTTIGCQTMVSCPPTMSLQEFYAAEPPAVETVVALPERLSTDSADETNSSLRRRLFADDHYACGDDNDDDDELFSAASLDSVIVVPPLTAMGVRSNNTPCNINADDPSTAIRSPATLDVHEDFIPSLAPDVMFGASTTPSATSSPQLARAASVALVIPPTHPQRTADAASTPGPTGSDLKLPIGQLRITTNTALIVSPSVAASPQLFTGNNTSMPWSPIFALRESPRRHQVDEHMVAELLSPSGGSFRWQQMAPASTDLPLDLSNLQLGSPGPRSLSSRFFSFASSRVQSVGPESSFTDYSG